MATTNRTSLQLADQKWVDGLTKPTRGASQRAASRAT